MSNLKIIRIEVEGFRNFGDRFVLDLRSPVGEPLDYLVLAGPNGCGKTTILEAVLHTLGHTSTPWGQLRQNSRLFVAVRDSTTRSTYHIERTVRGLTAQIAIDGKHLRDCELDSIASKLASLPVRYISARRLPALAGPVQDETRECPTPNTEANRIWLFKDRLRKQQGRRIPGYRGREPSDRLWLDSLNAYWREFRDDGSAFTMTLVDPDNLDVDDWDLFLYRGEERICSIDAMSSGEQEIIAMAVPFITEPFDGLLLIDEPEQHLHPQWQGRVLRALRKLVPTSQVIVSTHADEPWDDAKSWERRLL